MEQNGIIKFRAWYKKFNTMTTEGFAIRCDGSIMGVGTPDHILMQFTGLRYQDKDCYVGDVIDIGQTVNGQSTFVINGCIGGYDVRYAHDTKRKYEYDINELLDIGKEDSEIKIIGNIYEKPDLIKI